MTDITAKLAEALERVLTWPLPQGTVESYSLPPWLAADAREALATYRQHTEAQAGGTEGATTDAEALCEITRAATLHGVALQRGNLSRWSTEDLQREAGRLQRELTLRVCGDPVAGIGLKVGAAMAAAPAARQRRGWPMKTCSRCKLEFPLDRFYRDRQGKDGLDHRCKPCSSKRRAASGYKRESKRGTDRTRARSIARNALLSGQLVREPCFMCGAKAEMHHPSYSSPLLVTWLCRPHHRELHRDMPPASRSILAVSLTTGERKVLPSMSAGVDHGFQPRLISLTCNGHQKSHRGWAFSFIEQAGDKA